MHVPIIGRALCRGSLPRLCIAAQSPSRAAGLISKLKSGLGGDSAPIPRLEDKSSRRFESPPSGPDTSENNQIRS